MSDDLLFCGHCEKLLPRSTFYRHRNRYFINGKWISSAEKDGNDASDEDKTTDEHDAAAGDFFL